MNQHGSGSSKGRFDGLDVQAMVAYFQHTLAGRRVVNIYDGTGTSSGSGGGGETYIFKLEGDSANHGTAAATLSNSKETGTSTMSGNNGNSNDTDTSKQFLLLESGIRFHAVQHFQAPPSRMPTPFCSKLRKHLRGLRLESVSQIGSDRVVLLQFGAGPSKHSIVLELYAKGNLILTDREYTVLALLRSHVYQTTTAPTAAATNSGIESTGSSTAASTNNKKDNGSTGRAEDSNSANTKNDTAVVVQVGQVYPVSYATSLTHENNNNNKADDAVSTNTTAMIHQSAAAATAWAHTHVTTAREAVRGASAKKQRKLSVTLKTLLGQRNDSGVSHYGPALIEHCIRHAKLDPNANLVTMDTANDGGGGADDNMSSLWWSTEEWSRLQDSFAQEAPRIVQSLTHQTASGAAGYILYRPLDNTTSSSTSDPSQTALATTTTADAALKQKSNNDDNDKILYEFLPMLLLQHEGCLHLKYDNFSAAVEEYFDRVQHQKTILKAAASTKAAATRLEKVRADQRDRLDSLAKQQRLWLRQAETVEWHATPVDQALAVINSALDSGMDWDQLEQVVRVEQEQNANPVAKLIHKLDLEEDAMILRLEVMDGVDGDDDDTGDDESNKSDDALRTIDVRILLKESAHANASRLFAQYRASKEKSEKTVEASAKALAAAEETARRQLADAEKRAQQGATIGRLGTGKVKPLWFEKFHWFVTTDNYLVLGGKDAHQNELLVKRYLRRGDAYLHADVHGASSVIVRAKRRRRVDPENSAGTNNGTRTTEMLPLSEQALAQAGHFTICRSAAWSSRMVTSAWWVESHQVSKTAPTGEYLTVGSFMIRGKKNYLPPSHLEMGLAVLFRLGDEESIARHKNERRDFALLEDSGVEKERNAKDIVQAKDAVAANEQIPAKLPDNDNAADPEVETGCAAELARLDIQQNESTKAKGDSPEKSGVNEVNPPKKRGLSAKDRRMIKKYGSLEAADKVAQAQKIELDKKESERAAEAESSVSKDQAPAKRGQKAKQKRMKKYADQDDEDREFAMLALQGGEKSKKKKDGSKGSKQTKANISETQVKVAAETVALLVKDSAAAASKLPDEVRIVLEECVAIRSEDDQSDIVVRWDKFDASTLDQLSELSPVKAQTAAAMRLLKLKKTTRIDNFSASLGGIVRTIKKHGHENLDTDLTATADTNAAKRKPKTEKDGVEFKVKDGLDGEDIDESLDDEAIDDTGELLKLTGKPHPDDVILCAVPVCAPYQTISQYTYRVKLTPGSMKRGKSSKQCLDLFLKATSSKANAGVSRQHDMIKKVADTELVNVICADVKISAAGASKAAKKQKANIKKKKNAK